MAKSSKRTKLAIAVIAVLVVLYILRFADLDLGGLPLPSQVERREVAIEKLEADLQLESRLAEQRLAELATVAELARHFYLAEGRVPTNEIQNQIETMAYQSGFRFNRLSAPFVAEHGEYMHTVDVTIGGTANVRTLSRFLQEVENHEPLLVWTTCTIRPNRSTNPNAVIVSGKVRAYVLDREVTNFLTGADGEEETAE